MSCHVVREEGGDAKHIGALKEMWFSCDHKDGCDTIIKDVDIPREGLTSIKWECRGGKHYCPSHRLTPIPAQGTTAITAERQRQVAVEGWTPEHDAHHSKGELARAAACYALGARPPGLWPWEDKWWKPSDTKRNLEKAGALIAAEIDRLTAGGK